MTSGDSVVDVSAATWREQAVARSLDSARLRAESRLQRFLDAAFELINTGGNDFTVQEVVERSGQSLRSFYQYFGGKQELLLAVFEESVRSTAERLRERVQRKQDPFEQLHTFVIESYRMCRQVRPGKPAKNRPAPMLAEFAQQLLTAQPKEAARAFGPLVSLFEEILTEASAAGAIRADINHRRVAGIILEAIMFNVFSATIGGAPLEGDGADPAEELWDLLLNGMRRT
jgi:AcrR family transcriptional regulator